MCKLPSSWPPARVEGRVRAAARATTSVGSGGSGSECKSERFRCKNRYLSIGLGSRAMFFLTFLGMSRAIRMVFRSNLDEPLPEMVSKTSKRRETSLKKSKKRQAIASAGSGALGSLWGLWELLGGVLESLGRSPGGSLYRQNSRSTARRPLC